MKLIRGYTAAFLRHKELVLETLGWESHLRVHFLLKNLLLVDFLLPAGTVCLETEFTVVVVARVSLTRLKFCSC